MFKSFKAVAGLALVAASMYATSASAIVLPLGFANVKIAEPNVLVGIDFLPTTMANGLLSIKLGSQTLVDVKVFAAPVPEPETFAMMGLGLGLVAFAARRRRNSSV